MPRFRSTGLRHFPTRFSSEKFCMLRAPIWITSADSSTAEAYSVSISSVTMPTPVFSRTFARSFSPSSPIPWKA